MGTVTSVSLPYHHILYLYPFTRSSLYELFTMHFKAAVFLAVASGVALAQEDLQINSPPQLRTCIPTNLQWTGGESPYFLQILQGGSTSDTLVDLGEQDSNSYRWEPSLDAGTEVTLGITDNSGNTAYSSPVTITEGNDGCLDGSSSAAGGGGDSSSASEESESSSESSSEMESSSSMSESMDSMSSSDSMSESMDSMSSDMSASASASGDAAGQDEDDDSSASAVAKFGLASLAGVAASYVLA